MDPSKDKVQVVVKLDAQPPKEVLREKDTLAVSVNKTKGLVETKKDEPFSKPNTYKFDRVYDASSTPDQLYEGSVSQAVLSSLRGGRSTIATFGPTENGKTQVMDEILDRAFSQIMATIKRCKSRCYYSIQISCLDIYLNDVYDLLGEEGQKKLKLRKDTTTESFYVRDLTSLTVEDSDSIQNTIKQAKQKQRALHQALQCSSGTTHTIVRVLLSAFQGQPSANSIVAPSWQGVLSFADLAGNERDNRAQTETSKISTSLLALSSVVTGLLSHEKQHIPYRDSKLTMILKESLDVSIPQTSCVLVGSVGSIGDIETEAALQYMNRIKQLHVSNDERGEVLFNNVNKVSSKQLGQKQLDSEFDLDLSSISVNSAKHLEAQQSSVLNLSFEQSVPFGEVNKENVRDGSNVKKSLSNFFDERMKAEGEQPQDMKKDLKLNKIDEQRKEILSLRERNSFLEANQLKLQKELEHSNARAKALEEELASQTEQFLQNDGDSESRASALETLNMSLKASNESLQALCQSYLQTINELQMDLENDDAADAPEHTEEGQPQEGVSVGSQSPAVPTVAFQLPSPGILDSSVTSVSNRSMASTFAGSIAEGREGMPSNELEVLRVQNDDLLARLQNSINEAEQTKSKNDQLKQELHEMKSKTDNSVSQLQKQLNETREKLTAVSKRKISLESQVFSLTSPRKPRSPRKHEADVSSQEVQELRTELDKVKASHSEVMVVLAEKEDECYTFGSKLAQKEDELTNCELKIVELQGTVSDLTESLEAAQKSGEEWRVALDELKVSNADVREQLARKEEANANMQALLSYSESTLAEKKGNLQETEQVRKTLEDTLKEKNEELITTAKSSSEFGSENQFLKDQVQELNQLTIKQEALLSEKSSSIENLSTMNQELKDIAIKHENQLAQLTKTHAGLVNMFEKCKSENLELLSVQSRLKTDALDLDQRISALTSELNNKDSELRRVSASKQEALETLQDKEGELQRLSASQLQLNAALSRKDEELLEWMNSKSSLTMNLAQLKNQLQTVELHLDDKENTSKTLEAFKDQLENEVKKLAMENNELQGQLSAKRDDCLSLSLLKTELEESMSRLDVRCTEWKAKCSTMSDENDQLRMEGVQLSGELDKMARNLQSQEQAKAELVAEIEAKDNQLELTKQEVADVEKKLHNTLEQKMKIESALSETEAQLEELHMYQASVEDMSSQATTTAEKANYFSKERHQQLENDFKILQVTATSLQSQLDKSRIKQQKLTHELQDCQDKVVRLEDANGVLSKNLLQTNQETRQARKSQSQISSYSQKQQVSIDELKKKTFSMKTDLSKFEVELRSKNSEVLVKDSEIVRLQSQCSEAGKRLEEKETALNNLSTSHSEILQKVAQQDDERLKWMTEKSQLTNTLTKLRAEIRSLTASNESNTKIIQQLEEVKMKVEGKLAKSTAANKKVAEELELAKDKFDELLSSKQDIDSALARAQTELKDVQTSLKLKKEECQAIETAKQALSKRLVEVESELNLATSSITDVHNTKSMELQVLADKSGKQEKGFAELKQVHADLIASHKAQTEELRLLDRNYKEAEANLQENEDCLISTQALLAEFTEKYNVIEPEYEDIKARFSALQLEFDEKSELEEQHRQSLLGTQEELQALKLKAAESCQSTQTLKVLNTSLQDELTMTKQIRGELDNQLLKLKEMQKSLGAELFDQKGQVEKLLSSEAQLKHVLIEKEEECATIEQIKGDLEEALSKKKSEYILLGQENAKLTSALSTAERQLSHFETKDSKSQSRENSMLSTNQQLQNQLLEKESELDKARQVRVELEAKLVESEASLKELVAAEAQLNKTILEKDQQLNEYMYSTSSTSESMKRLDKEAEKLKASKVEQGEKIAALSSQVISLKSVCADKDEQLKALEIEKSNLAVDLANTQKKLHSAVETNNSLQLDLDDLRPNLAELEASCFEKQEQLEFLTTNNNNTLEKLMEAEDKLATINRLQNSTESKLKETDEENNHLLNTKSKLNALLVSKDNELRELNKKLHESLDRTNQQEEELIDHREAAEIMASELKAKEDEKTELGCRLNDFQSQLETALADLQIKDKELSSLRTDHESTQGKIEELELKVVELTNSSTELTKSRSNLIAQIRESEEGLVSAQNSLSDVRAELKTTQDKYKTTAKELEACQTDLQETTGSRDALTEQLAEEQHNLSLAHRKVAKLEISLANTQTELEFVTKEKSALIEKISKVETNLALANSELCNREGANEVLARTAQELETTASERMAGIESLTSQLANSEDALTSLRSEHAIAQESRKELTASVEELEGKLEDITIQMNKKERQCKTLKRSTTTLTSSLGVQNAKMTRLAKSLEEKDAECSKLLVERKKLERQLADLKEDIRSTKSDLSEASHQVSMQKQSNEALAERLAGREAEFAALINEKSQLMAEYSAKEQQCMSSQHLGAQVKELETRLQRAEETLSSKLEECRKLTTSNSEYVRKCSEKEDQCAQLVHARSDLVNRLVIQEAELSAAKSELITEASKLTDQISSLKCEVSLKDQQITILQRSFETEQEDKVTVSKQSQDNGNRLASTQKALKVAENSIQKLEDSIRLKNEEKTELLEAQDTLRSALTDAEKSISELEELRVALDTELVHSKAQVESNAAKYSKLEEQLATLSAEKQDLIETSHSRQLELERLRKSDSKNRDILSKVRDTSEKATKFSSASLADLQHELDSTVISLERKEKQLAQINEANITLNKQITEHEDCILTLQSQIEELKESLTNKHDEWKQAVESEQNQGAQLVQARNDLSKVHVLYADLMEQYKGKQSDCENLVAQCTNLTQAISNLEKQLVNSSNDLLAESSKEKQWEMSKSELTSHLAKVEVRLTDITQSRSQMVELLTQKSEECTKLAAKKLEMESEIGKLRTQIVQMQEYPSSEPMSTTGGEPAETYTEGYAFDETKLRKLQLANEQLLERLRLQAEEMKRFNNSRAKLLSSLSGKDDALAKLTKSKAELVKSLNEAKQEQQRLKKGLNLDSADSEQMNFSALEKQLVDQEQKNMQLHLIESDLTTQLIAKGDEVETLRKQLQQTNSRLKTKELQLKDYKISRADTSNSTTQGVGAEGETEGFPCEAELAKRVNSLKDEVARYQKEVHKLESEVERLKESEKRVRDLARQKDSESKRLRANFESLISENEESNKQTERLVEENEDLARQIVLLKKDSSGDTGFATALAMKEKECKELIASNSSLKYGVATSEGMQRSLERSLQEARSDSATARNDNATIRKSLQEAESELSRLTTEHLELRQQFAQREEELTTLSMQQQQQSPGQDQVEELRRAQARVMELEQQVAALQNELMETKGELTGAKSELREARKEAEAVGPSQASSTSDHEAKVAELAEKEKHLTTWQGELEDRSTEVKANMQDLYTKIQQYNERVRSLNVSTKEFKKMKKDFEGVGANSEEQRAEIQELTKSRQESQDKLTACQSELQQLREAQATSNVEITQLKQSLKEAESEPQSPSSKTGSEDLARGKEELAKKIQMYNERVRVLNKATKDLKQKRDEFRAQQKKWMEERRN